MAGVIVKLECSIEFGDYFTSINESSTEQVGIDANQANKHGRETNKEVVNKVKGRAHHDIANNIPLPSSATKPNKKVGKKIHACSYCSKIFPSSSHVKVHERMHTKEKPFPCSYCSKQFVTKQRMQEHEWIHTKEKPFSCSNCPKKFTSKQHMTKHERRHTNDKPFSCSNCPKTFARKEDMTMHERIHTDVYVHAIEYAIRSHRKNSICNSSQ